MMSINMWYIIIQMNIYIYMCVCMCVCVKQKQIHRYREQVCGYQRGEEQIRDMELTDINMNRYA